MFEEMVGGMFDIHWDQDAEAFFDRGNHVSDGELTDEVLMRCRKGASTSISVCLRRFSRPHFTNQITILARPRDRVTPYFILLLMVSLQFGCPYASLLTNDGRVIQVAFGSTLRKRTTRSLTSIPSPNPGQKGEAPQRDLSWFDRAAFCPSVVRELAYGASLRA